MDCSVGENYADYVKAAKAKENRAPKELLPLIRYKYMASPHSAEALVHSMGLRQVYPSGYRRGCCLPAVGRAVLWFLREELARASGKSASSLARLPSVKEVRRHVWTVFTKLLTNDGQPTPKALADKALADVYAAFAARYFPGFEDGVAAWLAGCRADILRDGRGMLLTEAEAVWSGEAGPPVVFLDTAAVAFTTAYLARKMGVSPEDFFERVYVTLDGECGGGWTDDGGRLEEKVLAISEEARAGGKLAFCLVGQHAVLAWAKESRWENLYNVERTQRREAAARRAAWGSKFKAMFQPKSRNRTEEPRQRGGPAEGAETGPAQVQEKDSAAPPPDPAIASADVAPKSSSSASFAARLRDLLCFSRRAPPKEDAAGQSGPSRGTWFARFSASFKRAAKLSFGARRSTRVDERLETLEKLVEVQSQEIAALKASLEEERAQHAKAVQDMAARQAELEQRDVALAAQLARLEAAMTQAPPTADVSALPSKAEQLDCSLTAVLTAKEDEARNSSGRKRTSKHGKRAGAVSTELKAIDETTEELAAPPTAA